MTLKRYYTLEEAAEFIRALIGSPFQAQDIFDLARRGEVTLCVYVSSRRVTLCDLFGDQLRTGPDGTGFFFDYLNCYIELSPLSVDRKSTFPIHVDQIWKIREDLEMREKEFATDIVFSNGKEIGLSRNNSLDGKFKPYVWTFCKEGSIEDLVESATSGRFEFDLLPIWEKDIVVPAEDLLKLRHGINTENDKDKGDVRLSGKTRNKAAQIIAGLVMAGFGKNIHGGRIEGIGEVLADLARVGVTVDEGVLRQWIRDGAALIPPPVKA